MKSKPTYKSILTNGVYQFGEAEIRDILLYKKLFCIFLFFIQNRGEFSE